MASTLIISPRIVEGLYREALELADEVRHTFALGGQLERISADEDPSRVALSSEGLRTTTRMMHAIAWLLNHRAYFMDEISEVQLRRQGRLAGGLMASDARQKALLAGPVADLVVRTQQFYARLLRLDSDWRLSDGEAGSASAIQRLRDRIEGRIAS